MGGAGPKQENGSEPSAASPDPASDSASVDSFLRDVARAPAAGPPGSADARIAALAALTPGAVLAGRFRLERKLGEGGMGVVWSAVHTVTRKSVALKLLKRSAGTFEDDRSLQRFLREARAASAVRHPGVVEVHDVIELEDGSPVMVMELLSGETLAQRLSREKVLPLPELARVMVHVCSAVGCAHALGIVHRDLKPENIFLARSPTAGAVKVLDFGIAKLTATDGDAARSGAITGTGAILGTPYYMAPEQLFGEKDIDHRADIWAIGIILYEALTGERPTRGDNIGQIYKIIVTDAIAPLRNRAAHLPEPVLDLVARMLSRERSARPSAMSEVLSVLSAYTDESFVLVSGPPAPPHDLDPRTPAATPSDAEGPVQLHRSGVELPPLGPAAPARATRRFVLPLAATAVIVATALASWTLKSNPAPPSRTEVVAGPAPATATATATATAPATASALAPAPAPAPPSSHHPSASPRKSSSSAVPSSPPPPPPAPASHPAPPVDPGSYQ